MKAHRISNNMVLKLPAEGGGGGGVMVIRNVKKKIRIFWVPIFSSPLLNEYSCSSIDPNKSTLDSSKSIRVYPYKAIKL